MKSIIALSVALFSLNTFASDPAPYYYSAKFKITNVSPMCPRTIPTGAVCMGLGSIVTVSATIGCTDTLLLSDFKAHDVGNKIELHVASVVRQDPAADRIRCARAQVVTRVVPVHELGEIIVVNNEIQY